LSYTPKKDCALSLYNTHSNINTRIRTFCKEHYDAALHINRPF